MTEKLFVKPKLMAYPTLRCCVCHKKTTATDERIKKFNRKWGH